RCAAQTRGNGLLAARPVASLEKLDDVRTTIAGRGAAVARRIERTRALQRREVWAGRLPRVWPRNGGPAEGVAGGKPRALAAHSDVQSRRAVAESFELRR